METKTMLYHGLPAIIKNGYWVMISPKFDEVVRIEDAKISEMSIYEDLKASGFFEPANQPSRKVSLLTLITTSDCNLHCKYCFANSGDCKLVMSDQIAFAAVRRAIRHSDGRKLSIAFFGGEPSLTPALIKRVVAYAKEQAKDGDAGGVEFSITTNGIIGPEFVDYLIEQDFLITISADGPDFIQDLQRPLKGGGKSSPILEKTVKRLAATKRDFKIRSTVTEDSVNSMVQSVEWLSSLGAKKLHFEPISIAGRAAMSTKGEGTKRPEVTRFAENLKSSIRRGAELDVRIVNSSFMNFIDPPQEFCEGNINRRFAVSYNGSITTCVEVQDKCHPVAQQFIVGNYDELIGDFVIRSNCRERACMTNLQLSDKQFCLDCFARRICGGGCPVRNFHTTGDSSLVDPYRCQLIKIMLPFVIGLFDEAICGG